MDAKNLLVNDGGDRQTVKTVREGFPQFDVVSALAFVVKSVNSVDRRTFVVTTQQKEILRVLDLVSKEKTNGFQRLLSTIDII